MPARDQAQGPTAAPNRSYLVHGAVHHAGPIGPGLHVVATPIGNLRDVTLRALETLAAADLIACEDTRVSRKLLSHYGIATPTTPYHDHNAESARPHLLARLAAGAAVALISDAGTPLVSDPGYKLVRDARDAGHAVFAVPGASATLAALSACGLPTDSFFFDGFLPAKALAREARIAALARIPASLVLFETGPRLASALAALADGLGAREAAVCRELTKLHEAIRRGPLPDLAQDYAGTEPRGEIVIVIAPPLEAPPDSGDVERLLTQALTRLSVKEAVAEVASATGVARRDVYQRALTLARERDGDA